MRTYNRDSGRRSSHPSRWAERTLQPPVFGVTPSAKLAPPGGVKAGASFGKPGLEDSRVARRSARGLGQALDGRGPRIVPGGGRGENTLGGGAAADAAAPGNRTRPAP